MGEMMSSVGRLARIWAWAVIPAIALGLFVQARSEGFWDSAETNFDRPISSQFRPGKLNPDAVRTW
jgi:hypothetical protein